MRKRKAIYILLVCIIICKFSGYGQSSFTDSILQRYHATKNTHQPKKYFLLQLKENASQEIKHILFFKAQRKFSELLYIVDTTVLNKPFSLNDIEHLIAVNNYWKLSPAAEQLMASKKNKITLFRFQILCTPIKFSDNILRQHPRIMGKNIPVSGNQNIISLVSNFQQIEKLFLKQDEVVFIDVITEKPKEELGTPGFDLSANKLNMVHSQFPAINGQGQHVSIKEDFYDTTDIDIKGRYELSPLASSNITNHANFMATIIAGAGNSVWYATGVANEAIVSSSSFEPVLPDADNVYLQNHITVQNHSYGTAIDNNYGLSAMAFDKSANNNQKLLHVFSSGNSGDKASASGNYAGITGFANLTGNFKMAKNIITVGAVDSFGNVEPLSSKGPAYDGRIKPDLVAFQKNGTSEAAALVSGTTLLLQQYYKMQHTNNDLPATLAKAILINTADDIAAPGPDFTSGFGNLNASKAMGVIRDNHLFTGTIGEAEIQTISIAVPANISLLKVVLAWNDTAASPLVNKALVNDVDIELTLPAENKSWKPWVLNSFANTDSLNSLAVRKRDSLNNVEQITIDNPLPGNYELKIKGYNLPSGNQKYYVVYNYDSLNYFKWQAPEGTDIVETSSHAVLRWQNSFNSNGILEYSFGSSNTWHSINGNTDLNKNYFYWDVPDTVSQAMLRMKIGNDYFYTDTFFITTLLKPAIGYICGDSVLVYWNKLKNTNRYQLYKLGQKYMEPFIGVSDTIAVISAKSLTSNYLAVAPVLKNDVPAQKSYAFNYSLQGAGCFINSFYINQNTAEAVLHLSLGTLINIAAITFEKQTDSGYKVIASPAITNQADYSYVYRPLAQGISYFRARILLNNGQQIYSKPEAAFYAAPGKYILFPVPLLHQNDITLLTALAEGETILLVDVLGRTVLRQSIISSRQLIKTATLQSGQYFYLIYKKGIKVATGKILIL